PACPPPSSGSLACLHRPPAPRAPPSFPTRRSSDLPAQRALEISPGLVALGVGQHRQGLLQGRPPQGRPEVESDAVAGGGDLGRRSEEHTSELQSRENLVCRLLLEKKNKENRSLLAY